MRGLFAQGLIHDEAQTIDDCWNRIGIFGDKSCPKLPEHIHCRNCAVYSAAATRLLDRYSFEQEPEEHNAQPMAEQKVATRSLVVFRLGGEWLGLNTVCLDEVARMQASALFDFNKPAKPLPQALNDFSRLTGLSVVYTDCASNCCKA